MRMGKEIGEKIMPIHEGRGRKGIKIKPKMDIEPEAASVDFEDESRLQAKDPLKNYVPIENVPSEDLDPLEQLIQKEKREMKGRD
ncbi:MAG: hypothetical protein V1707_01540 [bacterium]